MDPSDNNSFGNNPQERAPIVSGGDSGASTVGAPITSGDGQGSMFSTAPVSPVLGGNALGGTVSSGTGDIILNSGAEKKTKKWWIIGGAVAGVVTMCIIVGILFGNGVIPLGGKNEQKENSDFYVMLNENQKNVADLTSLLAGIIEGEASLAMFMLPKNEYAGQIESLNLGISSLKRIKERVEAGPRLDGVVDGIDIGANYARLKDALAKDSGKYQDFVDIVSGLYKTFEQKGAISARDTFGGYDGMYDLAVYVDDYFETRNSLSMSYIENNCENNDRSEVCMGLDNTGRELNGRIRNSNDIMQRSFVAVFGDLNNEGDGSIIYCLNKLYVATGAEDER